jgi:hypothetical protein
MVDHKAPRSKARQPLAALAALLGLCLLAAALLLSKWSAPSTNSSAEQASGSATAMLGGHRVAGSLQRQQAAAPAGPHRRAGRTWHLLDCGLCGPACRKRGLELAACLVTLKARFS